MSINGVVYTTSETQLLVSSLTGLTIVTITAIDNAGRRGIAFSEQRDFSSKNHVLVSKI